MTSLRDQLSSSTCLFKNGLQRAYSCDFIHGAESSETWSLTEFLTVFARSMPHVFVRCVRGQNALFGRGIIHEIFARATRYTIHWCVCLYRPACVGGPRTPYEVRTSPSQAAVLLDREHPRDWCNVEMSYVQALRKAFISPVFIKIGTWAHITDRDGRRWGARVYV